MIVRKARLEDLERIVDFNFEMQKETEGKTIDKNVVREGVKAIFDDELKGFYLVAEKNKGTKFVI